MQHNNMVYLNKKQSYALVMLCCFVYVAGYIGRLNYSASLVEIISVFGVDKAAGGLVSTFFFFAYGAGQLVNGILSKRYNPRIVLALSLAGAAIINFLMPFASSLSTMRWLWMINGILQSALWCTIIRTVSIYIPDALLPKAILILSPTIAVGTFCAYGLSAIAIAIGYWQLTFFVAAGIIVLIALVWFFGFGHLKKQTKTQKNLEALPPNIQETKAAAPKSGKKANFSIYLLFFLISIIIAAIANGFVKDGTVAWTPSVLYEEFGIDKWFSVILTFCLPLVSVFGAFIVSVLIKKHKNFPLLVAMFYTATVIALVLTLLSYILAKQTLKGIITAG